MADLGTLNTVLSLSNLIRIIPTWASDYRLLVNVPVNGALSGVVQVNGAPVAGYWVRCYYRKNGFFIAQVKSDANGQFSFSGLDPGDLYYCTAFDDLNQAPDHNAQIFDLLVPV